MVINVKMYSNDAQCCMHTFNLIVFHEFSQWALFCAECSRFVFTYINICFAINVDLFTFMCFLNKKPKKQEQQNHPLFIFSCIEMEKNKNNMSLLLLFFFSFCLLESCVCLYCLCVCTIYSFYAYLINFRFLSG